MCSSLNVLGQSTQTSQTLRSELAPVLTELLHGRGADDGGGDPWPRIAPGQAELSRGEPKLSSRLEGLHRVAAVDATVRWACDGRREAFRQAECQKRMGTESSLRQQPVMQQPVMQQLVMQHQAGSIRQAASVRQHRSGSIHQSKSALRV